MAQAASHTFEFSGGDLCLDFVNTLEDRPLGEKEYLTGWADLVAWGEQAGLLSRRDVASLRKGARADARGADRAFARAIDLREGFYRIFRAIAADRTPAPSDVAMLNDAVSAAMGQARIERDGDRFVWAWTRGEPSVDRLLRPVVRSAADLLTSSTRVDVRECASGTCSWLFIDSSPTRRRRWCSMKTCGNRDKARRFYRRQQRAKAQG